MSGGLTTGRVGWGLRRLNEPCPSCGKPVYTRPENAEDIDDLDDLIATELAEPAFAEGFRTAHIKACRERHALFFGPRPPHDARLVIAMVEHRNESEKTVDEVMLRRAAEACRNLHKQASVLKGTEWFEWVAPYLDRLADQLAEPPDTARRPE